MAGISWVQLRIDMFDNEKIKIIQSMPEGDALLVIWIRLIALAGKCNSNGLVLIDDDLPYSEEMLSVIFAKPLSTVKLALKTFENFHMIETTQKGIYITNFDKYQNVEGMDRIREQNRIRKQRERDRKKALCLDELSSGTLALPDSGGDVCDNSCEAMQVSCDNSCEATQVSCDNSREVMQVSCDNSREVTQASCDLSRDVTNSSHDKSREVTQQNKNKNKNKEIYNISSDEDIVGGASAAGDTGAVPERKRIDYQRIMTDFHDTCTDFPEICAMTDARKKKIRTLLNEFEKLKIWPDVTIYDRLHRLFVMAQNSDFLSGRDQKWNRCSFDWIINRANALKIVEGNYNNKGGVNNERKARSPGTGDSASGPSKVGSTTSDALERFRRNNGDADV